MSRQDLTERIVEAKVRSGLSWAAIAEAIDRPEVWTVAALLGEHPLSLAQSVRVLELLGLDTESAVLLTSVPYRGSAASSVIDDPTIYRFYEALKVYGPALKELIHEKFGDGIMSAINFSMDLNRVEHPGGARVVVTMSGKFLAYEWNA